jgi:hypothetical protein
MENKMAKVAFVFVRLERKTMRAPFPALGSARHREAMVARMRFAFPDA